MSIFSSKKKHMVVQSVPRTPQVGYSAGTPVPGMPPAGVPAPLPAISRPGQSAASLQGSQMDVIDHAAPSIPTGMWEKCPSCSQLLYAEDLQVTGKVCPKCQYHFRITAAQRIQMTADEGSFEAINAGLRGGNPLDFPGYDDKLRSARAFTGMEDAISTGAACIQGNPCVICAMDSQFMMGSMGGAVGEKLALAVEHALEHQLPLVIFTVSGGARMQEGMVSLMQMAKVSGALGRFHDAGLLYIAVLTDPTTGGVTASFAMLGDITLAEPGALIGFAGQRVIRETTRQTLPDGFQRAEFLLAKGFVDAIVPRSHMADTLGSLLSMHAPAGEVRQ